MSLAFRRIIAAILVVVLFSATVVRVHASENTAEEYIRQILNYYIHYQKKADAEINDLLAQLETVDPEQAILWQKIMDNWSWTYDEMTVNMDVLPDNLPQDDSLCILIMGYRLNENGTLRPELVDRLTVALHAAEKYPNAWILCTGGATSNFESITEGQQMAAWLVQNGVAESRILVETEALSTTENVSNAYSILKEYPQIDAVAVVTSDYHIRRSCMMFNAVSLYYGGSVRVAGNAACAAEDNGNEGMYTQAWGLAILAGVEIEDFPKPELYEIIPVTEAMVPEEPAPVMEAEVEPESKVGAEALWIAVPFILLAFPITDEVKRRKKERLN